MTRPASNAATEPAALDARGTHPAGAVGTPAPGFRPVITVAVLAVLLAGMTFAVQACGGPQTNGDDGTGTADGNLQGNEANRVVTNAANADIFENRDNGTGSGNVPNDNVGDNQPPDNQPDTEPVFDPGPEPEDLPEEIALRRGVEMEFWVNFAAEKVRAKAVAISALDELLVLGRNGHIYDYTNQTQFFDKPVVGMTDLQVEPAGGIVWCVSGDRISVVNPREGSLSSTYLRMPRDGHQLRIDEQGRLYLFGPDESGRGYSLILFNQDGSFLKLLTIDEEIRDVAASFTANRLFVATPTEVFSVTPPRQPSHLVSLGSEFAASDGSGGITSLLLDEPGGAYIGTEDAVLWLSHAGTLTTIATGIGGTVLRTSTGIAVYDGKRQVVVRLENLDAALTRDRVRARAAEELREGLSAFARKNYHRATVSLTRGLRFYPRATRVLYPLAVSRFQTGDYEGAQEAWTAFRDAHPDIAGTLPDIEQEIARATGGEVNRLPGIAFNLGYAELRQQNWHAAMREFERSLAFREDAAALYNLAIAQLHLGLVLDAQSALQDFIRIREESGRGEDPEVANARRLLEVIDDPGAVHKLLDDERDAFLEATRKAEQAGEDMDAARGAYNDFLASYPDGVFAPYAKDRLDRIGDFADQKAELDAIEAELRQLREDASGEGYDTRYFNAVAAKYTAFAKRHPDSLYIDYILGKLGMVKHEARQALLQVAAEMYRQRRYRSAQLIWSRLLEWHPQAVALNYNLGQVYRQLEDWGRAIEHFEAYEPHASGPQRQMIQRLLPAIEQRMQAERVVATEFVPAIRERRDIDGAEAALRKALSIDEQYGLAWYQLALVFQQKASPAYRRTHPNVDARDVLIEALRYLTIALKLKPRPDYLRTRARLYENMRDFEAAAADYTSLIQHHEDWRHVMARANCYKRLARDDEAIADFRRVAELNPELRAAMEHEIRMLEENR